MDTIYLLYLLHLLRKHSVVIMKMIEIVVHLSQSRLYNLIRTRFYWNNLHQDERVASCVKCFSHKANKPLAFGNLFLLSLIDLFRICTTSEVQN